MTKTQPTHKKLPKACIAYAAQPWSDDIKLPKNLPTVWLSLGAYPVAVIPTHTPAQAKQIVRAAEFLRLSEEEKVEVVSRELWRQSWKSSMLGTDAESTLLWKQKSTEERACYLTKARAVLRAMNLGGEGK